MWENTSYLRTMERTGRDWTGHGDMPLRRRQRTTRWNGQGIEELFKEEIDGNAIAFEDKEALKKVGSGKLELILEGKFGGF